MTCSFLEQAERLAHATVILMEIAATMDALIPSDRAGVNEATGQTKTACVGASLGLSPCRQTNLQE